MTTHVMLDIETLGTRPGCAVLSIGAVEFDPRGDGERNSLYCDIDAVDCQRFGLAIDADTVKWWMQQPDKARMAAVNGGSTLPAALGHLSAWLHPMTKLRLWTNGINFDLPILEAAYRACGITVPWSYRDGRDVRTLMELAGLTPADVPTIEGLVEHNALHDCLWQVKAVQMAFRRLNPA